jgi:predicted RNase H-like HicB family nuclease
MDLLPYNTRRFVERVFEFPYRKGRVSCKIKPPIEMSNHLKHSVHSSKPPKINHRVEAELEIILMKEEDTFVAYCPAIDVASYGKTEKDARKAFDESLEIFIEETFRKGTLERSLLNLGWAV